MSDKPEPTAEEKMADLCLRTRNMLLVARRTCGAWLCCRVRHRFPRARAAALTAEHEPPRRVDARLRSPPDRCV